ncbi:hypothetical protein AVEN_183059-2-1, partial [Araneus ventricosus]
FKSKFSLLISSIENEDNVGGTFRRRTELTREGLSSLKEDEWPPHCSQIY